MMEVAIPRIFIDGSEGTAGLQIYDRLRARSGIELLTIDESKRKDASERKRLMGAADLVIFCLPDDVARESVALAESSKTRILDASTAHRVADGWAYGLPELSHAQRASICSAARVANPGCHATGVIMLLFPLISTGLIPPDHPLSITSVTGYTGGGKKMIAQYETADRETSWELDSPRSYSLGAPHKHMPEIVRYAGLAYAPPFIPIVADYPMGLQVIVALRHPGKRRAAYETLAAHYAGRVNIDVFEGGDAFTASNVNADTDKITLRVQGYDDIIILTAQFGNLGKGAAGAAVQNINLMLGFDEYEGLAL